MRAQFLKLTILFLLLLQPFNSRPVSDPMGPPVDIVFCLDLSGSTNGLIDRMRNHIWDYVNLLQGTIPRADFRFGFIGYARPSFGKENYYVKVISDLTHDIEGLTHELLKLRTQIEKGDQFVGAAIKTCAENISWNER